MRKPSVDPIYFDNAATTRLSPAVLEAMLPYLNNAFGNPSSLHSVGREAKMAVEEGRKKIAALLGVKPRTIIFTSCGTESNNTAILTAIRDLKCDHIITSKLEHHAVLNTVEWYAHQYKIEVSYVNFYEDGSLDQNHFKTLLREKAQDGKKCLVTLMHGNNETGAITEISWIAVQCKKWSAIFHSDCVQTIGHYQISLPRIGVHMASASAHKFHGPKGVGLLYVDEEIHPGPLLFGGGQERKHRAGTENVAGIVGAATALQEATEGFAKDKLYVNCLKDYLKEALRKNFPSLIINTGSHSLYSVLNVSFVKNEVTEGLLFQLDKAGICVSGGSACSGGGSHVMAALGKADDFVTIRFSFSKYNNKEEVDKVIDVMQTIFQPQPVGQ